MALVAPHAVNWQVKQCPLGEESEVATDLVKLLRIVRKSGFTIPADYCCQKPTG